MADDDLSTRLHWPADPLDGAFTAQTDAAAADPAPPSGGPSRGDAPRWVLGEQNDVALLRQEVSDLRHAIDDLADRVQLRQVRAALDELRAEVLALRRVVVEWPELDQLTSEVGALRSHLLDLQESSAPVPTDPAVLEGLAELRASVEQLGPLRTPLGALAPIVSELGELREEFVSLRRRIALRTQSADPVLDDAQLERIVESVVERVLAGSPPSPSRRRR